MQTRFIQFKTNERKNLTGTASEKKLIAQVTSVGVFGNVALATFKLVAGILGNSGAMVSDAIHSFSDVLATAIAWVGVKTSKKSADDTHPYGHERFESVASLFLGLILLVTGIAIGVGGVKTAVEVLEGRSPAMPEAIALVAAFLSIVVKEAMFWYTRHAAKVLMSSAFMADAWHHRSDAISSVAALIGIGGAMLGFPVLEPIATVFIAIFIAGVAFKLLRDALNQLLDSSVGSEFEEELSSFVNEQNGVLGVDMARSRRFGNRICIDLEIKVDGKQTLEEAHTIAENVRLSILETYPNIKFVTVHENPA